MSITNTLSDNLENAFRGNNWTDVSIAATLVDISFAQANLRTAASPNTIAMLVNHLWYWNTVILQRMAGDDPVVPLTNGFDPDPITSESEWQALVSKAERSFNELAAAIRNYPLDKLGSRTNRNASTISENLFGIVEHAYYHLGQVVILKHIVQRTR